MNDICTEYAHTIYAQCNTMTGEIGSHPPTPLWGWLYTVTFALVILFMLPTRTPQRTEPSNARYHATRHLRGTQGVHRR